MTDLQKIISVLDNQQERGIKSGDWDRLDDYIVSKDNTTVELNSSVRIGFCFTKNGRFKGIFQW